jgi:hypothetical protein
MIVRDLPSLLTLAIDYFVRSEDRPWRCSRPRTQGVWDGKRACGNASTLPMQTSRHLIATLYATAERAAEIIAMA